jgi:hypothetical protein
MTNEHFIDNTIYLHKISSSYIKNKLLNKIPKTASPEEFIEILLEIFISNLSIYQLEQLFFDSSNIGLINEKIIQMIQAEVEKRAKVKNIFSLLFNKKRKKEMRYASQLLPKLIKKPIDNISTVYEEYEEIDPDIFSDIDFQMLDNETVKHAQKLIDVIQKSKRT